MVDHGTLIRKLVRLRVNRGDVFPRDPYPMDPGWSPDREGPTHWNLVSFVPNVTGEGRTLVIHAVMCFLRVPTQTEYHSHVN